MRNISTILVAVAVLAFGPIASASENGGFAVGAKVGTLGIGVEVNYPINSMFTISVGSNAYSSTASGTTDGIDYDVDTNLQTIALLANIHPFAGSFRITAGVMSNSNELIMTAKPDAANNYNIGGNSYDATTQIYSMEAAVNFKKIAPYAGIGWGFSSSSGLGFMLDIGVLMQGEPNVDFTIDGAAIVVSNPIFQADLAQEEANAENDIKGFTSYPVISAGLNYRF